MDAKVIFSLSLAVELFIEFAAECPSSTTTYKNCFASRLGAGLDMICSLQAYCGVLLIKTVLAPRPVAGFKYRICSGWLLRLLIKNCIGQAYSAWLARFSC